MTRYEGVGVGSDSASGHGVTARLSMTPLVRLPLCLTRSTKHFDFVFFRCDFKDDQINDQRTSFFGQVDLVQPCRHWQSDTYSDIPSDFHLAHGRDSQHANDSI